MEDLRPSLGQDAHEEGGRGQWLGPAKGNFHCLPVAIDDNMLCGNAIGRPVAGFNTGLQRRRGLDEITQARERRLAAGAGELAGRLVERHGDRVARGTVVRVEAAGIFPLVG